jgi:hypothetical protein
VAKRDERIARGLTLLGDPAAVDLRVLVPAGSVLMWHPDLFHRVSRSGVDGVTNHDVPIRHMMGGGFSRGSEPTASYAATVIDSEEFAVDPVAQPVWAANLAWLRGGRTQSWKCAAGADEVPSLRSLIENSGSDRERTSAAHRLGWLCKAEGGGAAAGSLLGLLAAGREAEQRAAMFGLCVGGGAGAADRLLELISELLLATECGPPEVPLQIADDGSTLGLHKSRWQVLACACFAFSESVERASPRASRAWSE